MVSGLLILMPLTEPFLALVCSVSNIRKKEFPKCHLFEDVVTYSQLNSLLRDTYYILHYTHE